MKSYYEGHLLSVDLIFVDSKDYWTRQFMLKLVAKRWWFFSLIHPFTLYSDNKFLTMNPLIENSTVQTIWIFCSRAHCPINGI